MRLAEEGEVHEQLMDDWEQLRRDEMYIVILETSDGYFGPFNTQDDGQRYIDAGSGGGKVVALIKPWAISDTWR